MITSKNLTTSQQGADHSIKDQLTAMSLPVSLEADVHKLTGQLNLINSPLNLSALSISNGNLSEINSEILKLVKQDDLDEIGAKLGEVVSQAKSINVSELGINKSKIPVIGGWIDRFKNNKDSFILKFQSVDSHLKVILTEINNGSDSMMARIHSLELMYQLVGQEYQQLGVAIIAGKFELESINQKIIELEQDKSPLVAEQINNLKHTATRLDKRIGDLQALQLSALQTMPMIKMIQANNHILLEKFANIKELTIPAWQRQFMLAISLVEQQKSADLVNRIDEATNDFLKSNAQLLKENSISVAKSNQRGVIDIETLQEVNAILISTIQDVQAIRNTSNIQRMKNEVTIMDLQKELRERMAQKPN